MNTTTCTKYNIDLDYINSILADVYMGNREREDGKFSVEVSDRLITFTLKWRVPNSQIMYRKLNDDDTLNLYFHSSTTDLHLLCLDRNTEEQVKNRILEACYKCALSLFTHECKEQTFYNGINIVNPHPEHTAYKGILNL